MQEVKISEAFPGKHLRGPDLGGKSHVVTISSCVYEEVGQDKEVKPVLYFEGRQKGLVLNVTGGLFLKDLFGSDGANGWIGKQVELYPIPALTKDGKPTEWIRLKAPNAPTPLQAAPQQAAPPDSIPNPSIEPAPQQTAAFGPDIDDGCPF